jgi:hypothetical protein
MTPRSGAAVSFDTGSMIALGGEMVPLQDSNL